MVQTTESAIERDLEEATKKREDLLAKRAELDEQIHEAEQRFHNLKNAQAALQGKWSPEPRTRKPRDTSGTRAPKGSRDVLKTQILDLLKQHPEGLESNKIAAALPESKQLANVLSLMKSQGQITQPAKRGPYKIAPPKKEPEEAA